MSHRSSMLAALRSFFSFPLLSKELMERAARPRTYWLRVAVAVALYAGFWLLIGKDLMDHGVDSTDLLGSGRMLLNKIVPVLLLGIYVLVPAMLCGVVTQEKERDSLVLLLLTNLRPWQIAVQKYAGGLIPALSFLLLGMPLVALAFAYGGITMEQLGVMLGILVFAVLQIGAIALWASCWCRSTVSAFLTTYAVAAALFFVPVLVIKFGHLDYTNDKLLSQHIPVAVIYDVRVSYFDIPEEVVPFLHIGGTTLLFLFAAIWHLPRRAFVPSRNWLPKIFAAIDRWMHAANRIVGGVHFGRKPMDLPEELPLLWREKRTRALARPEHVVRLLVLIMVPTGVIVLGIIGEGSYSRDSHTSLLAAVMGVLAVLTLSTTAANGIVNERVNQTFEILLTTPMDAASILRQKARALHPLTLMAGIPLLSVLSLKGFFDEVEVLNWLTTLLSVVVYFPLVTWLSIWTGLRARTRIRAISLALAILVGWCALPIVALVGTGINPESERVSYMNGEPEVHIEHLRYLYLLSPIFAPVANESGSTLKKMEPHAPWLPVTVNFTFYGGILFVVRRHCLKNADRYLRR